MRGNAVKQEDRANIAGYATVGAEQVPPLNLRSVHGGSDQSIRFSRWARAYYDQQRARGNDHHAALRALAYKWIRILFRCWKERTPYDEERYIDALQRRESPLAKHFA